MKTVLVTGGTHKDAAPMGVLALNIRDVAPHLADEMIIFHDGIPAKQQQLIADIFPTKFYQYHFDIGFKERRANRSLRYFSEMLFCKYECFRLLEEYDRVIWTDYDVLIRSDLRELTECQAGLQIVGSNTPLRKMFRDTIEQVDMRDFDLQQNGIATPLFVMTKDIGDYRKHYSWCVEMTKKYAVYTSLPEQCIFTMLIQTFHIDYENLSDKQYALHPRDDDGKAEIVHCYGRPKFWEGLRNDAWEQYYRQWIDMGGNRYRTPVKEKLIAIKERFLQLLGKQPTY